MIHASDVLTLEVATRYYRHEYTRGDYCIAGRALGIGSWQGQAVRRLGLAGDVSPASFAALLAGRSPTDGRQLVAPPKASGTHRAAWDFQAAPDKSVSLVALVGGDERVIAAHLAAAHRAFERLEHFALAYGHDRQPVATRNLAVARFDHDASRALDPHLHSHHLIFNVTERRPGEWRALDSRGIFAALHLATAVYQVEIGRELQRLGYEVHADPWGFVRIAGISENVLAAFSKRKRQILADVERRGGSGNAADRRRAALYTRARKNHDIDPAALRAAWRAEAAGLGLDLAALRRAADLRRLAGVTPPQDGHRAQARAAVAWAAGRLAERQATFSAIDLEDLALRHAAARGPGLDDIRAALAGHPDLLHAGGGRLTTLAALRLEQANFAWLRTGLNATAPPILARAFDPGPGSQLGPDPLRVARHLLESRALILGVEGMPGTGKTSVLATVREAAERAGWTVRGCAVSTAAVARLRHAGIEAAALQGLAATPPAAALPRQLWIVDDASLLGNRDAAAVLEGAHRAGARLVLVGDSRQHHTVEAGAPWRALQAAGLRPAQLDIVRRQQSTHLLAAVQLAAAGRAGDAIRHLDARGHVVEIRAAADRHAAMVRQYVAAPRQTLMIAPSSAECRELNLLARRQLVAAGQIAPQAIDVEVAVSKGASAAQRADIRRYDAGDVVTYVRAAPAHGIRAGDTARVVAVDHQRHTLRVERHRDGACFDYDPRRLRGGDLARAETRQIAAGDRVQLRGTDRARGLAKGATGTVREATPAGRIVLELDGRRGRTVTLGARRGPSPLDYAYAVTGAAQGARFRRVLATIDVHHGAELVNRRQAEVTLSRASYRLAVYTDDRAALPSAVDRAAPRSIGRELQTPSSRSHPHASAPLTPAAGGRPARQPDTPPDPVRRASAAGTSGHRAAARSAGARAEPGPAAQRGARARPGGREHRSLGARDPGPRPRPLREPRPQPRNDRPAERPRNSRPAPHCPAPLRLDGRPGDPRHPGRAQPPLERGRPFADPVAHRLTRAVQRWQQSLAAGGTAPRPQDPPPPAARAATGARHDGRGNRGDYRHDRRDRNDRRALNVAGAGSVRRAAAPARFALTAARNAAAVARAEEPERQLVRLIAEIGVQRAIALLPTPVARAVMAIREVAQLFVSLAHDR